MKPTVESIDDKIKQSIEKRYSDTIVSHRYAVTVIENSYELNYLRGLNYGKVLFALTHVIKNKTEHVFEFLMDSYDYFIQNQKEVGYLLTLNALGNYYDYNGNYEKALHYLEEWVYAEKKTDFREAESDILSSLGKVYMRLNKYDEAIKHFLSSLQIRRDKNLKPAEASSLNLLGRAHSLKGLYKKGLEFYEQSINIRKKLNDDHGIVWCYIGIASMYELKGENYKAILYFKKAQEYNKEKKDQMGNFHIAKGLGKIYIEHSDYDLAKEQITRLLNISEKINSKPLIYKACRLTANYYEMTRQFQKATEYYKKYIELKEEVLNIETQNRIAQKMAEFEIMAAKRNRKFIV